MTGVFAEYTGNHPALAIDWSAEKRTPLRLNVLSEADGVPVAAAGEMAVAPVASDSPPSTEAPAAAGIPPSRVPARSGDHVPPPSFSTFWELARAVNRSDPAALWLAGDGADSDIPMDGRELRKLLGTFWFRSVFPRLSSDWQDRVLNVLVEEITIPDHAVRNGRRTIHLHEMSQEQRQQIVTAPGLADAVRADLQLMITVARLWGEEALGRFEFTPAPEAADTSRMAVLLQPFRHS